MEAKLKRLRNDPVLFAKLFMGFEPFDYQEKILLDPSKRICACMGRQVGKTTTIAVKVVQFAFTRPDTTTLVISPSLRQSMILFSRIEGFIYRSEILRQSVVRRTRTIIQLSNGAQIVALPCSENLLRGYTADLVICDEAAFMPERIISSVLFPMLATTGGLLILLSTPWGKDNLFYRAFMDPKWSIHHVKSNECPLISKEFLEEQRGLMTEEQFQMEYEAEFSEASTTYLPQDLIRSCVVKAEEIGIEFETDIERFKQAGCFAGVDLGKRADYSVISAVEKDGDLLKLVFHKQFDLETPYPQVIGALKRMHELAQFKKIMVDRTGVGEAVLDEISDLPVDGVMFTEQRKANMMGGLKVKMEQGNLAISYDRDLCDQLNEQQYEYKKTGRLHFWHPLGRHDDRLWSLALAVYATRGEESTLPIAVSGP